MFRFLVNQYREEGKKIKTVRYQGKIPSLNDLYGTKHWTQRNRAAVKYHEIFRLLLLKAFGKKKRTANEFTLFVFFNSRHDTDNIVGIEKYFTDTLVNEGYVVGDNKEVFRGLVIDPDEALAKNTVEFVLVIHK